MRGKNILWISLMAILSLAMLPPMASASVTNTKISVTPDHIIGMPGDTFVVFINIENVEDLYTFGFSLRFAPYSHVLIMQSVIDGGFLVPDPFMTHRYDRFHSIVSVAGTLVGQPQGVSGSGILVMIEFFVAEAGDSPLELLDTTLLNSNLEPIPHNTFDSYYEGPMANLVMKGMAGEEGAKRDMKVGGTQIFTSKIKSLATVPLYARVKFDMKRDDGELFTFYAGQHVYPLYPGTTTVYLYVNEFSGWWNSWATTGTDPYLNAPDDGSYVTGTDYCQLTGFYGFEDLTLAPGESVVEVELEAYTDGPYDDENDFDALSWGTSTGVAWLGSLYATGAPAWVTPRWIGTKASDELPELLGPAGTTEINDLGVIVHYWTADGLAHEPGIIDAMRLKVTIGGIIDPLSPPYVILQPGEILKMPRFIWDLGVLTVGKYYTEVTLEYKYYEPTPGNPAWWIKGEKISTFTWWVTEDP